MEETSLSLKTVFDHPIKFSSFLPHRLSAFAVLIQFRWSLKRANKKLKYSSDWKWNLLDFSTKRNRLFNDWWSKRNETKREDFRIYHILIDAGVGYDSETIPKASWRWKIISCHWVKEIDNDSSVNAFSF